MNNFFCSARLFFLLASVFSSYAHAAISIAERQVLLNLYADTNGSNWTSNTNWLDANGTECSWYGVYCNNSQSNVVTIILSANGLSGSIMHPFGELTQLASLDISGNAISGPLPSLNGLTNLTTFSAGQNHFSGTLPALEGQGLSQLKQYSVAYNLLNGQIPELNELNTLTTFDATHNMLTDSIPSLTGLTNLSEFEVGNNQLTGPIPSLDGLANMHSLIVSNNQLSGSIPALTGVPQLSILQVGENHLTGTLPAPPSNLEQGLSSLCGNDFPASSYIANSAWDSATAVTPWYHSCDEIFKDGFDVTVISG